MIKTSFSLPPLSHTHAFSLQLFLPVSDCLTLSLSVSVCLSSLFPSLSLPLPLWSSVMIIVCPQVIYVRYNIFFRLITIVYHNG